MSDSFLDKLKRILQGAFLSHVPDHPSHGGNTGDTEWDPDRNEQEKENEDADQCDSR